MRRASVSAAMSNGVSLSDILNMADWSRDTTFRRFYYRSTSSNVSKSPPWLRWKVRLIVVHSMSQGQTREEELVLYQNSEIMPQYGGIFSYPILFDRLGLYLHGFAAYNALNSTSGTRSESYEV